MTSQQVNTTPQSTVAEVCPHMLCPDADAGHWSAVLCDDGTCAKRGCRLIGKDE